jgi:hypothetical protein
VIIEIISLKRFGAYKSSSDNEVKYTIQMHAYSIPVVAPAHSIQTIVY